MRIIIVRHGEPDYEHDCLTEKGRREAEVAAKRLLHEGIETVYSSSMGRAYETAQAFTKLSGIDTIHKLDFMREIQFGFGEALYGSGNPWDETDRMATDGEEILDLNWKEAPFYSTNIATSDVDRVAKGTDEWMLSLGYRREGQYYRNIREDKDQHTVALFCHGGSGTAMLSRILNLPFPYLCAIIRMPHTAITTIRLNSEPGSRIMPVLELASDAVHLKNVQ